MRKLGVRFRKITTELGEPIPLGLPALGAVALYDVESGSPIGNVRDMKVSYEIGGLIVVTAEIIVSEQDATQEPLFG